MLLESFVELLGFLDLREVWVYVLNCGLMSVGCLRIRLLDVVG